MSRQNRMDTLEDMRLRLAEDIERLVDKSRSLRDGLQTEARTAVNRVRDDVSTATRDLAADAKTVFSQARTDTQWAVRTKARNAARTAAHYPEKVVKEQPLVAFGVAAAVGVGLAMLIPRRTHAATVPAHIVIAEGGPPPF